MKTLSPMKKLIAILMIALFLTGCASTETPAQQPSDSGGMTKLSYLQIDQETAKQMMEADDGHVIVDVRRQDEDDAGHIPGAILIPNESITTERPEELPDLKKLKVMRPGLELGTVKKDRFEPAHALALWLKDCRSTECYDPDSSEIKAYLHGDVVPSQKQGWCLVKAGNYSIGWGKGDKIRLKNHYPKGLRR